MSSETRPRRESRRRLAPLALIAATLVSAVALAACGDDGEGTTGDDGDAGTRAELMSYLPAESTLLGSVDLKQARKDLDLPADADPFDIKAGGGFAKALARPELQLTLIAADGFSPLATQLINLKPDPVTSSLDGSAILQAASNRLDLQRPVSVIRTTQSFDQVADDLSSGYARNGDTLIAKDPKAQVTSVADAGDGVIVFAGGDANAEALVESPPGGPQALVDLISPADEPDAIAFTPPASNCITAFGGWNGPDGSGTLALTIDGGAEEASFHIDGLQGSPVSLSDPAFDGDLIEASMERNNDSLATSGSILEPTIRGNLPLGGLYSCG